MNNILKSLRKTAKNAHNGCLYKQTSKNWICQVYETSSYKNYNILEIKMVQIN